jgi:Ca2+-binding RTX toxin-like protein
VTFNGAASTAIQTFTGGSGADVITGGTLDDVLNGGAGNDTITGGAGDDTILGGSGDDVIRGQEGNDQIFGEAGNDQLSGDLGDDVLVAPVPARLTAEQAEIYRDGIAEEGLGLWMRALRYADEGREAAARLSWTGRRVEALDARHAALQQKIGGP